jgi:hypothetical protein
VVKYVSLIKLKVMSFGNEYNGGRTRMVRLLRTCWTVSVRTGFFTENDDDDDDDDNDGSLT